MPEVTASADVIPSPIALLRGHDVPHADRAVRRGELLRIAPDVFAFATDWEPLAPWDKYLARVHATALRHPDAVFALESAAALRGLPVLGAPRDVHVVASPLATSRVTAGVRVHTAEILPCVEMIGGLLVVDAAHTAVGIARLRHHAIGLAVADAVLREHPEVVVEHLLDINRAVLSSRGRRHARWVIDRVTGIPESPLESVSLAAIEWLGFPPPTLQHWVFGDGTSPDDRLDFWWEVQRAGGEADGDRKYSQVTASEMLRARRARDLRLRDRGVETTAHWAWQDVVNPASLRSILWAAGLRPERLEEIAPLRSLTQALSPRR
jgi:hypothetical protein